ncbi:hypothetical protein HYT45_02220 [Candidatus Uhrbacteria bacterium]|nr:hypothetical protein [Candidatus Wildermuthbacteria bacterium]MBI2099212.1 hypothetical protein [Candidatus Uhrbacteria bacterium]
MVWQNWHTYTFVLIIFCGLLFLAVYLMERREKRRAKLLRPDDYLRELELRGKALRAVLRQRSLRYAALDAEISMLSLKRGEAGRRELAQKIQERSGVSAEICELRSRLERHRKYVAETKTHFAPSRRRGADISAN